MPLTNPAGANVIRPANIPHDVSLVLTTDNPLSYAKSAKPLRRPGLRSLLGNVTDTGDIIHG